MHPVFLSAECWEKSRSRAAWPVDGCAGNPCSARDSTRSLPVDLHAPTPMTMSFPLFVGGSSRRSRRSFRAGHSTCHPFLDALHSFQWWYGESAICLQGALPSSTGVHKQYFLMETKTMRTALRLIALLVAAGLIPTSGSSSVSLSGGTVAANNSCTVAVSVVSTSTRRLDPRLPFEAVDVLAKAMAKDSTERYKHAADLELIGIRGLECFREQLRSS